jgi:asparagine synthase (glutamine-hydrolysing)
LVAKQPAIEEICNADAVESLFAAAGGGNKTGQKAGQAAWVLLFYALWHRRHIRGIVPEGGVFDVLGG